MKSCHLQQHEWGLDALMLSEIRQRKTNTYDVTYMWNLTNKMNYKQNRYKLIDTENKLMGHQKGGRGGRVKKEKELIQYKLPVITTVMKM